MNCDRASEVAWRWFVGCDSIATSKLRSVPALRGRSSRATLLTDQKDLHMASGLDVYAPCPCGSGKKVKFCCNNALVELDRVARLHEKHQPQQALDALTRVGKQFPDAPIVPITRAQLLMEEERFDEAASDMREFVKVHPEIGHGHALLAMAHYFDVGFHEAKPEIHSALQRSHASSPEVLSSLAANIAQDLLKTNPMAAREHLALGLRLARDPQDRQALFTQLMKLDGTADVPYPLRSTHHLEKVDAPEGSEKVVKNAYRMSAMGCWEIAGKLFTQLTESLPNHWGLWKNIGLCRVWDDDLESGTEALHKAAQLAPNFEDGVECETIAQLLRLHDVEEKTPLKLSRFKVPSVSQALSILDGISRCVRQQLPDRSDEGVVKLAGKYFVLSAPPSESGEAPLIQAELSVYHFDIADAFGIVAVAGLEEFGMPDAASFIEQTLAGFVVPFDREQLHHEHDHDDQGNCVDADHDHDDDAGAPVMRHDEDISMVVTETIAMQERRYARNQSPANVRESRKSVTQKFLNEWYQRSLSRLEGKSPTAAAADAGSKLKACAAIYVVDAIANVSSNGVAINDMRKHLGLEPEAACETNDETIDSLSVMQSHRLPLQELSSEQLSHVLQRAMLVSYLPFTLAVQTEIAKRGLEHLKGVSVEQFSRMFTDVAHELGDRDLALEWCAKGREIADGTDNFQSKLEWAMKEFSLRSWVTDDPKLPEVVDRLWNYFGSKLPELHGILRPVLEQRGIPVPGHSASGLVLPDSMTVNNTGAAEAPKLWLPGS